MIGLIDYGSGNIDAIVGLIKSAGLPYSKLSNCNEFNNSISHLVLPGVGGFDETLDLLDSKNWSIWLNEKVLNEKIPILGICVGMQIMLENSSEGQRKGFGWIEGNVQKIPGHKVFPLPHMGWNSIETNNAQFFNGVDLQRGFYHLHNYYALPSNKEVIWATSSYIVEIPVVISKGNILGIQFHPEKSLFNGVQILKNFYNSFNNVKI
jgi:glutamine amidotransferase